MRSPARVVAAVVLSAALPDIADAVEPQGPARRPGVAIVQVIANGSFTTPWAGGEPSYGATGGLATMVRPSGDHCAVVRPSVVGGASVDPEGVATPILQAGVTAGCLVVPGALQVTAGVSWTVKFPEGAAATLGPPSFPALIAFPIGERVFPAITVAASAGGLAGGGQLVLNLGKIKLRSRSPA